MCIPVSRRIQQQPDLFPYLEPELQNFLLIARLKFQNPQVYFLEHVITRVSLDVSQRPYLIWKVDFSKPKLGDMDTELFKEWFQAFAQAAGITLHVENMYGENNHHIVESCFKGLARALRQAIEIDPRAAQAMPTTKGVLGS